MLASVHPLDVSCPESLESFRESCVDGKLGGRVDILFNNAGVCLAEDGENEENARCPGATAAGVLRETLAVNFFGALAVADACMPALISAASAPTVVEAGMATTAEQTTFAAVTMPRAPSTVVWISSGEGELCFLGAKWRKLLGSAESLEVCVPAVVLATVLRERTGEGEVAPAGISTRKHNPCPKPSTLRAHMFRNATRIRRVQLELSTTRCFLESTPTKHPPAALAPLLSIFPPQQEIKSHMSSLLISAQKASEKNANGESNKDEAAEDEQEAEMAFGTTPAYSLSKAAANAAVRTWAPLLLRSPATTEPGSGRNTGSVVGRVRLVAVCPGDVLTRMTSAVSVEHFHVFFDVFHSPALTERWPSVVCSPRRVHRLLLCATTRGTKTRCFFLEGTSPISERVLCEVFFSYLASKRRAPRVRCRVLSAVGCSQEEMARGDAVSPEEAAAAVVKVALGSAQQFPAGKFYRHGEEIGW